MGTPNKPQATEVPITIYYLQAPIIDSLLINQVVFLKAPSLFPVAIHTHFQHIRFCPHTLQLVNSFYHIFKAEPMAPSVSRRWERTEDMPSPTAQRMTIEPLYIVGIALACFMFLGAVLFWAYQYFRTKKQAQSGLIQGPKIPISEKSGATPRPHPPNAFNRAKMTASIVLPRRVENDATEDDPSEFVKPYLPPVRPMSMSLKKMQSNSSLRPSNLRKCTLPGSQVDAASMTPQELIDYHRAEGNFPISFAPFSVSLGSAASDSTATLVKNGRHSVVKGSLPSSKEVSLATHSHQAKIPNPHSRFSSFSASIRNSLVSWSGSGLSPTNSNFTFGKKPSDSPSTASSGETTFGSDERVIKATFNPLLPDELPVKLDEKVTVVETYDDGWCIIGRMNRGLLEVGAVPEFTFGGMHDSDTSRPMRSSSLGITVDLRVVEEEMDRGRKLKNVAPAGVRDSTISWSNF